MTPSQAAKILGCTPGNVRTAIREKRLTAERAPNPSGYGYCWQITTEAVETYRDTPKQGHPRRRRHRRKADAGPRAVVESDNERERMMNTSTQIRYPWDQWFNCPQLRLVRGKDFNGMPHAMAVQMRNAAAKRGLRVSVKIEEDTLIVTVLVGRSGFFAHVVTSHDLFANMTAHDRRIAARMTDYAIRFLWFRTGAKIDAFSPKYRTHAESLDFLGRHPRILRCVKHIDVEDGDEGKISKWYTSSGYAAGLLYLMGSSASDPDQYYGSENRREEMLDWSTWDRACDYFVLLAGGADATKPVRDAIAKLVGEGRDGRPERWAVIVTGWLRYVAGKGITDKNLRLKYQTNGNDVLAECPTTGGIDKGNPPEA